MKPLAEAAVQIERDQAFWDRNKGFINEIQCDPSILKCLLTIAGQEGTGMAIRLMQAMAVGIAIGMEMEKP